MKRHKKRIPILGYLLGLALVITALVLLARHQIEIGKFGIIFLTGFAIYLWGCLGLAKANRYRAGVGLFLGLFLGGLPLFFLVDRSKMPKAQRDLEDLEADEDWKAERAAKLRPLKGGKKVVAWLLGLFLFALGLAIIVGYEIHWARVVVPERAGMAAAISISADHLDPQNDGKLVHVTGQLAGSELLADSDLGVTVEALKLRRRVWMYQWEQGTLKSQSSLAVEDTHGNSTTLLKSRTYNYLPVWSEKVINSDAFHNSGYDNPGVKGFPDYAIAATNITLGAFSLTAGLVEQLDDFQTWTLTETNLALLAGRLRANAQLSGGEIYIGKAPKQAAIGDLKIRVEFALPTTVTVIAGQSGNRLAPAAVGRSGSIAQLRVGTFSVQEMTGLFAKDELRGRLLVWVVGGIILLLGGVTIRQACRK